jgi:hypothetical protein
MPLIMNHLFNLKFAKIRLFCLISGLVMVNTVNADIPGKWQLTGTLQVTAAVKGKSQTVKQKAWDQISVLFNSDGLCLMSLENLAIEGRWSAVRRKFKSELSVDSSNAVLRLIEKDLAAKSGLQVVLEAEKLTLSGSEQRNGSIKGSLKFKARSLFLDYGYKKGSLSINYDFVGKRPVN